MKTSDILRNSIIFVLFSVLFVPLVFSNGFFFPYIAGKNFAFRILIEIAGLLYALLLLKDPSYRPKKSFVTIALLSFVAIMGIATATSAYPYKSFWGNYERMEGYITILHLCLYFIILGAVFTKERIWGWFFEISLFASLIVGGNALFDLKNGIERIYGTLGNSTYLGVYSLVHVFIAALLLFKHTQNKTKADKNGTYWISFYKYIGFILFNIYIMFQTGTRGSFVGLVAGIITIAVLLALFEKQRKTLRYIGIGVLAFTILVVGVLGATKDTSFVKSSMLGRYASLITFDVGGVLRDQGFGRTLIWKVALNGVEERPILGWGQESFNYPFNKYYTPNLYGQEQWFDRAHNVFLDWLIAGGFLGLLAYLFLYIGLLWAIWKSKHPDLGVPGKAIITGLVVAYFFHNFFVFDNLASYIIFFAFLAYGHHVSIERREKEKEVVLNKQYVVATMVILAFAYVFYVVNYKPYQANTSLLLALQYQSEFAQQGSPRYNNQTALQDAYDSYDKALSYNSFGTPEAREQLAVAAQSVFQSAAPELQKIVIDRTKKEFETQIASAPNDARYYSIYGTFLSRIGLLDEALVNIRKAQALSPGKPTFRFDEAVVLVNKGQYEAAFQIAKDTYFAETSNTMALGMYAITSVYAGHEDIFNALLKENPMMRADPKIIQAFIISKRYSKAISLLESYMSENKNVSLETGLYLAAAYLESGNKIKALAVLNDLKKTLTDTQSVSQIDYYIGVVEKGATSLLYN